MCLSWPCQQWIALHAGMLASFAAKQCSAFQQHSVLCQLLSAMQIGAVNAQLLSIPWLSVRAIDLRPCLPSIEQADFLKLQPSAAFDVVVCSMVLNCVPSAKDRGQMLLNISNHLRAGGLAFVVIPLRCLNSSSRMTPKHFELVLSAAGFQVGNAAMRLLVCNTSSG